MKTRFATSETSFDHHQGLFTRATFFPPPKRILQLLTKGLQLIKGPSRLSGDQRDVETRSLPLKPIPDAAESRSHPD
jgi:hypothetical protein